MPSVAGGLMQVGPNPDAWKEKKMAQVGFWYVAGGKKTTHSVLENPASPLVLMVRPMVQAVCSWFGPVPWLVRPVGQAWFSKPWLRFWPTRNNAV